MGNPDETVRYTSYMCCHSNQATYQRHVSIVVTLLDPIWTLVMWVFHDTADVSASEAENG